MDQRRIHSGEKAESGVNQKTGSIRYAESAGRNDEVSKSKWRKWIQNPLKTRVPPIPTERRPSPEQTANFLSLISFDWMNRLLSVGYKRTLTEMDFPLLNESRHTESQNKRIMLELRRRATRGDKHPLLFSLLYVFGREFWFAGICQLLTASIQGLSPLLLKVILQYASNAYSGEAAPIGYGIGLVLGLIVMLTISAFSVNQWVFRGLVTGGMTRASLISLIYSKSLVISNRAKAGGGMTGTEKSDVGYEKKDSSSPGQNAPSKGNSQHDSAGYSNGKVMNLMSTDTAHIDQATMWSHMLWTMPLQLCIVITLLIINIGASALAGLALFAVMMPVLARSAKSLARRRGQMNKITDKRLGLTQEILQSVRFVKFFGWEASFLDQLRSLREREIRAVQVLLGIRSVLNAFSVVCSNSIGF